jgi:hypothetical protein
MVLPFSVLSLVTGALEKLGIRYVLVGSFASSMYGMYRATAGIDIVAEIKMEHVDPLYGALKADFYLDELTMRNAVSHKRAFNAIHYDSVFKIDIFISQQDEFALAQLDRRELRKLSTDRDDAVYVATAEDTILAKLRWYRAGSESSQNQWNDVLGILATMHDCLDLAYLDKWADRLSVADLLARAIDEVHSDL